MTIMVLIMLLGLGIATLWQTVPIIKETIHALLDPTAGRLLDWHPSFGLLLFTACITFITTLVQKYGTNQNALKQLREEQKLIQEQVKLHKADPAKQMELSKKSMELAMESMPLSMKPVLYTTIPFILFFRWFSDYFLAHPVKIFGYLSWFWAYLIFAIFCSTLFRKWLKVY